mmetsp:Transcript_4154/g.12895  ORF Transcript_4154/g.12895 Transcript_4154/m.12895 type:complete len:206 (-) Transcript_4154:472-1089(-)
MQAFRSSGAVGPVSDQLRHAAGGGFSESFQNVQRHQHHESGAVRAVLPDRDALEGGRDGRGEEALLVIRKILGVQDAALGLHRLLNGQGGGASVESRFAAMLNLLQNVGHFRAHRQLAAVGAQGNAHLLEKGSVLTGHFVLVHRAPRPIGHHEAVARDLLRRRQDFFQRQSAVARVGVAPRGHAAGHGDALAVAVDGRHHLTALG